MVGLPFKHFEHLGSDRVTISFVGDLKYGRTVHSLLKLLRNFEGTQIHFVAPEEIQIPTEYLKKEDHLHSTLSDEILTQSDVIYDTRIQRERFNDLQAFTNVKDAFIFTPEIVSKMHSKSILLHPLPRVNEITLAVDSMPQAKYFEQAQNGVPVRMALIADCLGL